MKPNDNQKIKLRRLVYLAGFFLNFSLALSAYVNSSFLETFVAGRRVGLIYSLAAALTIVVSLNTFRLTKRLGNKKILWLLTILNLAVLFGLVVYNESSVAIVFILTYLVFGYLLSINLDLYLENLSDDRSTGRIRGTFLTLVNLAWLLSPWLASRILTHYRFAALYAVCGLMLLPFLYLVYRFHQVDPAAYQKVDLGGTVKNLLAAKTDHQRNLRRIIGLEFLLNFFYAIMVIYLPIYLLTQIGLSWSVIGQIFTIMLLPFVLLDFVLGYLADRLVGEKEILSLGLALMGLATMALPFIASQSVLWWGAILFLTRVGAASVEMMKETYLFKQIAARDINLVFVSRNTYPMAYIIAPLIASLILTFYSFNALFLFLGLVMFLGLPLSTRLKDTK